MRRFARYLAAVAAVACVAATPAVAQTGADGSAGVSAYAIARIKVLAGSVWVVSPDSGGWDEATTNTPLTARGRVSVPQGSEAELQFHGGQFVLLTAGTDFEATEMDEQRTSFQLRTGEIRFDLPEDDFAPVGVSLPGGAGTFFDEPGRYWITVNDDQTSTLVVRRGTATVDRAGRQYRVAAGEEARIGDQVTIGPYAGGALPAPPSTQEPAAETNAGVPPVVYSELNDYGYWVTVPGYGPCWRPRVAAGWSPYVYGRWVWVAPYGWTWVAYEPWGWYPYHCGYWVTDPTYGWVWAPYGAFVSVGVVIGPSHRYYYHRQVRYVPCNVRFIPEGRNVRWVPLHPGERYRAPEVRRGDARLAYWNRSLPAGRVFVRGGTGAQQRVWRDVTVVHAERQQAVRTAPAVPPRRDMRPVRPENVRRPPAAGTPAATRAAQPAGRATAPVAAPRGEYGVQRAPAGRTFHEGAPAAPGRSQGPIPAPSSVRGAEPPRGESAPRDVQRTAPLMEPQRTAPSRHETQGTEPSVHEVQRTAPRVAPAPQAAPRPTEPRVAAPPPATSAPATPAAPNMPETPRGSGAVERTPARQAPERDYGGSSRGSDSGTRGGSGNERGGSRGDSGGGTYDRGGGSRGDSGSIGGGGDFDRGGGGGGYDRGGGRSR